MSEISLYTMAFFDKYSEFFKTSSTGTFPNRLNNRYSALIEFNKSIIKNSSILDLGSHDCRWSFAAIKNGAVNVLGIEGREHLVKNSYKNMEFYKIPKEQYHFIRGDVFEEIKKIQPETFDVVFCFGLFYHVINHMQLLEEIKRLKAKYLILDTSISESDKPIIELVEENQNSEASGIKTKFSNKAIAGFPSKSAVEMMLKALGFSFYYYDWHNVGIENWRMLEDYQLNRRISLVASNDIIISGFS